MVDFIKYKISLDEDIWNSFDDLPPQDLKCIFYNLFLDEYRICTIDKLEDDYRFIRDNFGDLIDEDTGNQTVDYYLKNTFHPTHWTIAPTPPKA